MLWYLDEPTALLWVAPVHVPGEVVFCSFRQDAAVAKSNTACGKALRTGILHTRTGSKGLDHYYASGGQHMSRSRNKKIFPGPGLFSFDGLTPALTSETSLRSQGGVVLWFRAAAAQPARELQSQSQSQW